MAHHASAPEVWIGFYKAHTGRIALGYSEAVEEALCFGWIDTTVRRIDEDRYTNRFVPRRSASPWSAINRALYRRLEAQGLVGPAGRAAFQRSSGQATYSYEHRPRTLAPSLRTRFRAHVRAWRLFASQPTGYRRLAAFWVMSAKRPATRARRLEELIRASGRGRKPRAFEVGRTRTTARRRATRSRRRTTPAAVK